MIEYKRYDRSYEDKVLKVFTESFVNYPLFGEFSKTGSSQRLSCAVFMNV